MTRHLPCPKCGPLGAMLPKSSAYPNGEPYIAGQYVKEYDCARCGRHISLSPAEYNGLPKLSIQDFERLAEQCGNKTVKALPTRELEGLGFRKGQAADLFNAGLKTHEDVSAEERRDG